MSNEGEPVNWRAVAGEYQKRLHALCLWTGFATCVALGLVTAKVLEWIHVDAVWVETIAMIVWLPLGAVAWYVKNRLEDWADQGLPRP